MFEMSGDRERKDRITKMRLNVLAGIRDFAVEHGYSPTVRELSEQVGVRSHSSIQFHLQCLEDNGYVERKLRKARSCRLTHKAVSTLERYAFTHSQAA